MDSPNYANISPIGPRLKPTEYLTHFESGQLSSLSLLKLVQRGFFISDVQAMLASSELYTSKGILSRDIRNSRRKAARCNIDASKARLSPLKSAVAYQYAIMLERALIIFGSQAFAEKWLNQPCKYLVDKAPLELLDNTFGFRSVEDYLTRFGSGIYQ